MGLLLWMPCASFSLASLGILELEEEPLLLGVRPAPPTPPVPPALKLVSRVERGNVEVDMEEDGGLLEELCLRSVGEGRVGR